MHPFGINPTKEQERNAIELFYKEMKQLPETYCSNTGECCKAGCPNMTYSEYLVMNELFLEKDKKYKTEIIISCLSKYLIKQDAKKPKSCLFLNDKNMCSVYDFRPFRCRLYGVIPNILYKKIVKEVSREMRVCCKFIPLCNQCKNVKIKEEFKEKFKDNIVPVEIIKRIETTLRASDYELGVPKQVQDNGFSYLTFHDWHILVTLGEKWMSDMTKLRLSLSDDKKEQFISSLKSFIIKNMEQ